MEPKLALTYDSQGGNGPVGVGWNLSGLSYITRCRQTRAQDGVTNPNGITFGGDDRYCLDGQRLLAVTLSDGWDGAEYRTEVDGFSKINSYGSPGSGPSNFVVKTKAGLIMEYGTVPSAQLFPSNRSNAISTWAVNKIADTKGNYMTVTYRQDGGQLYPDRIEYTRNTATGQYSGGWVQFDYEGRSGAGDTSTSYYLGGLSTQVLRLHDIKIGQGGQALSEYRLTYEVTSEGRRSALKSLQQCSDTSGECLPALSLTRGYSQASFWLLDDLFVPWSGYNVASNNYKFLSGDFDGDGRTDLIHFPTGGPTVNVWLSQGSADTPFVAKSFSPGYDTSENGYSFQVGDFNGDGRADLIHFVSPTSARVWLSNGDGTFTIGPVFTLSFFGVSGYVQIGDFNGDGKSDLLFGDKHVSSVRTSYGVKTFFSNGDGTFSYGSGGDVAAYDGFYWPDGPDGNINFSEHPDEFNCRTGDFNGDGKTDLIQFVDGTSARIWLSNGDGTFSVGGGYTPWSGYGIDSNNYNYQTGDFNGDGLTDLIHFVNNDYVNVWFSKGDGTFDVKGGFSPFSGYSIGGNGNSYNFKAGDFDGDGRTDFIHFVSGNKVRLWLSNGDGTFEVAPEYTPRDDYDVNANNANYIMGDFDGDGMTDMVHLYNSSGSYSWFSSVGRSQPVRFTTGFNTQINIGYGVIPDGVGDIYFKEFGDSGSRLTYTPPLKVVTYTLTSDGVGGARYTNYAYGTAVTDVNRGFQGFNWQSIRDQTTGISTKTYFRQDFPYTGMSFLSHTYAANGTLLSETYTNFACLNPADTSGQSVCSIAPKQGYFVYGQQTTQRAWNVPTGGGSVALPGSRTTQTFDGFGNALQIQVEALNPDGSPTGVVKTTVNQYYNDTSNWYLGRLIRSAVTSSSN